jgi:hypothetical protein
VLISDAISVQFKYNILLITALNKSYFGSLRIRDFRAGRLRGLKMKKDFIIPVTNKLAVSARLCLAHSHLTSSLLTFPHGDVAGSTWKI